MKATLRDSNLYLPGQTLEAKAEDTSKNSAEKAEFYDYPGGYAYHAANGSETGDSYVKARLQEGRRDREMYVGQGNVFPLATGARVGLNDPDFEDDKAVEYLITTSTHTFSGQTYAGAHVDGELETIVDFEGLLADLNWRPARVTPKSVMTGPQPATVVGKAGEVIDVDQYGRVRVQFDWDRIGTKDEKSSCWLRVSQSSAGSNLGHMVIPRIGEEVLVDFLDGDPDRPIITGRVYNATNMPPYVLPDNKTKSTWKSQTVGDSGDYNGAEDPPSGKGFNEIRFEDKGPSEEFFIHAQRIFNSWIRLDETRKTGRDTTVRVGRDRKVAIRNNETVTIEDGSRSTTIKQNDTLELQSGNYSMKIDSGTATIEAAQSITLKVAGNKIVIDTQGIHISGMLIELKADGPLSAQGLKTDLKADTMMTISGALVKIN
jgi:type VI secretion system secreted protein VgrG